jgi:hypothetical protein
VIVNELYALGKRGADAACRAHRRDIPHPAMLPIRQSTAKQ